jgi:DeoR family suf operon transcriptional repressor
MLTPNRLAWHGETYLLALGQQSMSATSMGATALGAKALSANPQADRAQPAKGQADHYLAAPGQPAAAGPQSPSLPTRDAALALLIRHGAGTAAELANRLSVSVQVMRRHLRSLEEEGLVEASLSADGPGRPSNRWQLTGKGQALFPDGSEHFALGLMQSLAGSLPPAAVQALLEHQAQQKALDYRRQIGNGPLQLRLGRLVQLRRGEGYVAECEPDGDKAWIISEYHCSVMRIAEQFPCVCDQELQLIRHTFPDCAVERVHWRLDKGHSCGFRLTPTYSSQPASSQPASSQPDSGQSPPAATALEP